jgi:tagatose-6-phosphate ketose/aldose isomerase
MADALQELLDLPRDVKEEKGLLHTPSEIRGQVKLWGSTHTVVEKRLEGVRSFLGRFLEHERRTVVLTGAGTSEFVGHCIEGRLRKGLGAPVNVVSSTKIVTNPEDVFIEGYHTLLVSFGRSGDSPESVGAVEIADQTSGTVSHLVVTCNAEGALNRWAERRAASGEGAARSGSAAGRVFSLCLDERTRSP